MSKTKKRKSYGNYFLIALIVIILDQIVKYLIKTSFNLNESFILIKSFLKITFITNTGSAFGTLQGSNSYLIFFSLIVLGAILFYWDKIDNKEKIFYVLIISGIIGNLIDRVIYGFVIDFISFSFWPAFNIADSALTIGIIGLIILSFKDNI